MTPPTGVILTSKIEIIDRPYPGIKVGEVGTIKFRAIPSNHTDEVEVTLDNDCLFIAFKAVDEDGYTSLRLKGQREGTTMVSIKAGNVVENVKVDTLKGEPVSDISNIVMMVDKEKYVKPGENFNIHYSLEPVGSGGTVSVEYSNSGLLESVVGKYKSIEVTGLKLGTTTLTIVSDNGVRSEPITVHVVDKLLVVRAAVRLGVSDVYVGEEVKLDIREFPTMAEDRDGLFDDMVVTSGDTDIAVINEYGQGNNKIYTVKAIKDGFTDITVECRGKTINGLFKLVVSEGVRPDVEETALDSIGISSSIGYSDANVGDVLKINLDTMPRPFPGMHIKYTMTSSDNSKCKVLSFADGTSYVQCLEAGNYTITLETTGGKTASTTINVV